MPGPHPKFDGAPTHQIALASGPIHYDLLLPLTDTLRARFAFATAKGVPLTNPLAQYLVVGWGSKRFYTTTGSYADLNLPTVLRAITGDSATLHLDVAGDLTDAPDLIWLQISDAQLAQLTQSILSSLDLDTSGNPIPLNVEGFGQTDAFFAAKGCFHLFHTCNVWIGETLRAAGIPFGLWTPTPQAIRLSAWLFD